MDDPSSQEPKKDEKSDSVDLSELASFSFGTQWSEASKSSKGEARPRHGKGGPRPGRSDRRPGGGPVRRDRRPQRPQQGRSAEGGAGQGQGDSRERDSRSFSQGGQRQHQGRGRGQGHPIPYHPYESEVFEVCFYPDDNCFSAIIKAMRTNHLTYELFHVAKLFMEKTDRFIASIKRRIEKGEKPEKVFISIADNMPFISEEDAILHTVNHHADTCFDIEEVEVEPPTGNFPFVNRCPFTKVLLGPPNYHKYEDTLRHHHRTRLSGMSFEKLQSSIETVREEEVVAEWLESQKKTIRYNTKPVEGEEQQSFDSLDDAIGYLRTTAKSRVVKAVNYARVPGTTLEKYRDTEAFKAMDGERQRQQRFPLDTANAIRGRMRREKFSIYKKGSKGITYVCATKRNFRAPGQVMSEDLDRIIQFLETNQNIKAKEMIPAFEAWMKETSPDVVVDEKKLMQDLHWLVADGYVSHFEDDRLFAQPVLEAGSGKKHHDEEPHPSEARAAADETATEAKADGAAGVADDAVPVKEAEEPAIEKASIQPEEAAPVTPSEAADTVVEEVAEDAKPEASTATEASSPSKEDSEAEAEPAAEVEPVAEASSPPNEDSEPAEPAAAVETSEEPKPQPEELPEETPPSEAGNESAEPSEADAPESESEEETEAVDAEVSEETVSVSSETLSAPPTEAAESDEKPSAS